LKGIIKQQTPDEAHVNVAKAEAAFFPKLEEELTKVVSL
jgi:hypothetical protein